MQVQHKLDLGEFVKNATWRELLAELVKSKQLDPWDIDIAEIVDNYIDIIKQMKILDLKIPANIVLAASILLHMKSDALSLGFGDTENYADDYAEFLEADTDAMQRILPSLPTLMPKVRMQPTRKISFQELMVALEEAMKFKEQHASRDAVRRMPLLQTFEQSDIDDRIEKAYVLVSASSDIEGMSLFSTIAKKMETKEQILLDLFIPLLFLEKENKLMLIQEEFFKEIIIKKV